jgi:putative ABC transport system permease protein
MCIPLKYNLRSLWVRRRSALATVICMALVVAVFILVMALANGLRTTFLSTGDSRNLLVIRQGAMAESSSQITVEEVRRTLSFDGIARDVQGNPLASAEVIVLVTMERTHGGKAHVQVRGLGPAGILLRPGIQLVEGRMFRAGLRECIVSQSLARRFRQCGLGQGFRSGKNTWTVVGIFEAQRTAYDSEIWMDADEAREAFHRTFYCSLVIRPENATAVAALRERIESDRLMRLRVLTETQYYQEQTKTAGPIQLFGFCLSLIMGLGAVFAAMNTMYASVGARTREIGTLRVLGYTRGSIYLAFMIESVLLSAISGVIGCMLALPLHGIATGTFNWKSFAEVAFEFRITGPLLAAGIVFSIILGMLGGWLPAQWAARKSILESLRAD